MKIQKWNRIFYRARSDGRNGGRTWLAQDAPKTGAAQIKGTPIPGSVQMKIDLPERVGDFTSTNIPEPQVVLGYLPADTSYAERIYTASDGFH